MTVMSKLSCIDSPERHLAVRAIMAIQVRSTVQNVMRLFRLLIDFLKHLMSSISCHTASLAPMI